MSGEILIYTTLGCPHSQRLIQIFTNRKIPFTEINLALFPLGIDDIFQRTGLKSIPQVFFNSKHIGGLQNILTLLQQGKLESMAEEALSKFDPATPKAAPPPPTEQPIKHVKMNPVHNDIFLRANCSDEKKALKKSKKLTFKGSEFLTWLTNNNGSTRDAGIKLGTAMKEVGYFSTYKVKDLDKPFLDDDVQYQFNVDRDPDILNGKLGNPPHIVTKTGEAIQRYPGEIGSGLLKQIFHLYSVYTNEAGVVNFEGLKADSLWTIFVDDTLELSLVTVLDELLEKEKLVFLLQLYEILRLHLMVIYGGPPTTPAARAKFVHDSGYKIQGYKFTLHVIASLLVTGKYPTNPDSGKKKRKDKLNQTVFPPFPTDPFLIPDLRVIFGTVKASNLSPPILYFYDKNVDFALHWATEVFCSDVKASKSKNLVVCPNILSHIFSQFETKHEFLQYLVQFVGTAQEKKMRAIEFEATNILFVKMPWEVDATLILQDIDPNVSESKVPEFSSNLYMFSEEEHLKFPLVETPPEALQRCQDAIASSAALIDLTDMKLTQIPEILLTSDNINFLKRLVLLRNSITRLPPNFGTDLSSLSIIDLSYNDMTEIPNCFADLHSLEVLNLAHNEITTISNRFCSLRNLKNLYLNSNHLQSLPLGFAQLRSVEDLNLSNNELASLPHNIGEMGLLEFLDVSNNKLQELPDLSNLLLLVDLLAASNRIQSMDFGLKGLRHAITMDLSNNEITVIPVNVAHLLYLNELDLSKNKISVIPVEICDLLCMKEDGLDLAGNPVTNLPHACFTSGISAIRLHYGWDKPLPKVPASRGRPMEMMGPPARAEGKAGQPAMTKALSVRDKRNMLMKNKTKQVFGNELIQALREKNSAQDSGSWLHKAEIDHFLQASHSEKGSHSPGRSGKPGKPQAKKDLGRGSKETPFIKLVESFNIEPLPMVAMTGIPFELQDFDFKPDYHTQFYHQPHTNFFGNVKGIGPVIISILDAEEEGLSKPRRQAERAKSMNLMRLKIKGGGEPSPPKSENRTVSKQTLAVTPPVTESPPSLHKSTKHAPAAERKESGSKSSDKSGGLKIMNLGMRKRSSTMNATSQIKPSDSEDGGTPKRTNSSVRLKKEILHEDSHDEHELKTVKAFVRTPPSDVRVEIPIEKPSKTQPKDLLKTLKDMMPELAGTSWKNTRDPDISENIVALEMKLIVKGYKFGLLYACPDQKSESEFFQNRKVGKNFQEFMNWLGETVPLKAWPKYNAGLDTGPTEATGKESLYTTFKDFEIMFHVSTMLPYTEGDSQQLARKRHLGNDIVVVLFQEGKNPPFDPSGMRSFFNHVFFVLSKDKKVSKERGETCYRIGVTYKDGVQEFLPPLPLDGILVKNDQSREYLLTKLINSERAAYSAPGFSKALTRTRDILFSEVVSNMTSAVSGSGWG